MEFRGLTTGPAPPLHSRRLTRRGSVKKSKPMQHFMEVLNNVVNTVRPFRARKIQPLPSHELAFGGPCNSHFHTRSESEEVATCPSSPASSSSSALETSEFDSEYNRDYDVYGETMIDMKAEELIAQIYEQIRVQNYTQGERG